MTTDNRPLISYELDRSMEILAKEEFLTTLSGEEIILNGGVDVDDLYLAIKDIDISLIQAWFRTGRDAKAILALSRVKLLIDKAEQNLWRAEKDKRSADKFYDSYDPERGR
jgi:hypothetical protein